MMKQLLSTLLLLALYQAAAFAPQYTPRQRTSPLNLAVMPPPPPPASSIAVDVATTAQTFANAPTSSQLKDGIDSYLDAPAIKTSSMTLSLKERPPPPTKEEIAAKKRNFNLIFWGGGFVAPFIATVFYFGPKFWEK